MNRRTRRAVLATLGVTAAAGLAGCGGGDGDGDGTGDGASGRLQGEDYPAIDEWLTETEVGDSADNYDGQLSDRRGRSRVPVNVGASGNGGDFAFAPAAFVVDAGTEIRWSWTGRGGLHNVEAEPDDQIGESDYEFSSGEAIDAEGVQFTQTLPDTGVALYHCEPHLSVGMKGGIAVE
jgi:halocyanin-like protein